MKNSNFQAAVEHFVDDLKSTHGANLVSIMLYGSAINGKEAEVGSELNVLVALEKITPEDLRLAQAPVREWQRIGHPLPVYFTSEELRDAADVFPIEFRNMERARRILYGVDPFEEIQLSDENMRHQTEYELRSKLIQLRRLYIAASTSLEKMTNLMTDSLASFAALFRAVLLLDNIEPPASKTECVRATARHLKLNINTFERIFELRSNKSVIKSDEEANSLFADYMLQIEQVIRAVDGLKITPSKNK
jgi:hypothetical protein